MNILTTQQAGIVAELLARGLSDLDIARRICREDQDPELLLDSVSLHRERLGALTVPGQG